MTEEITREIKIGFRDSAEAVESICDMFYKEKVDTPWVIKTVAAAYRRRLVEQTSWPAITDFDRLVKVFDRLNSNGIIALHNAGVMMEDGIEDAGEIRKQLQAKQFPCRGLCCYDSQAIEGAIDGQALYLTFGDFDNNARACVRIGKEIEAALREAGFKTSWDRTCETRILIKPFVWRKRFGNDNCSYDHSKDLLSHKNTRPRQTI